MIQIENLRMEYGSQVLFANVSISLNIGNRYGVVGANGSGKSTLLKLISNDISPTSGQIKYPSNKKIGFLKQNQFEFEKYNIVDVVLMGRSDLWELIQEQRLLLKKDINDIEGHRLADIEHNIAKINGYSAESDASVILNGLGFTNDQLSNKMSTLSGGYKLRVLLAQCLYSKPDILLLDEPNNHLDLESIAWLGNYLKDYQGVVVLVSHDHHFINNVATHILDIDYEVIRQYTGNYEFFQKAKIIDKEQRDVENKKLEKKQEELRKFYERFKAKATKARQAVSRKKQLDKMDDIEIIHSSRKAPFFKFKEDRPTANKVLSITELNKSFGNKQVLKNINLDVARGSRIAIIGPNGIGKTTLLKIVMKELEFDSGEYEWGEKIAIGYFAQNHKDQISENHTVISWLTSHFPSEPLSSLRRVLGQMLFDDDDVDKKTSALSGGEAARLIFAKLMMQESNVLLLDEPTNHLDLESIESLSASLVKYSGTIIFVSHDRYFVEHLAESIYEIDHDGYKYYKGKYFEFLEKKGEDYLNRDINVRLKKSKIKNNLNPSEKKELVKNRRSFNKELNRLVRKTPEREKKINEIEAELKEIELILSSSDIYENHNLEKYSLTIENKEKLDKSLETEMQIWEDEQNKIEELDKKIKSIDEKIEKIQV